MPDDVTLISTDNEIAEHVEKSNQLGLTPQLRLFCYEYIVDFDSHRAAAMVSLPNGPSALRRKGVSNFIAYLTDQLEASSLVSRDMVQHELIHNFLPMAKGEKPVHGVDRDGKHWSANRTDMQAFGQALRMMAQHSGFAITESTAGAVTININEKALGITVDGDSVEITNETD